MFRNDLRCQSDCPYFQFDNESKRGYSSDSSGLTPSAPYQWQDILNPNLHPMDFDAALMGVLRSSAEMDKILGLNDEKFQSVIDVLGQVSTL